VCVCVCVCERERERERERLWTENWTSPANSRRRVKRARSDFDSIRCAFSQITDPLLLLQIGADIKRTRSHGKQQRHAVLPKKVALLEALDSALEAAEGKDVSFDSVSVSDSDSPSPSTKPQRRNVEQQQQQSAGGKNGGLVIMRSPSSKAAKGGSASRSVGGSSGGGSNANMPEFLQRFASRKALLSGLEATSALDKDPFAFRKSDSEGKFVVIPCGKSFTQGTAKAVTRTQVKARTRTPGR
jgi:hypothetical protein